MRSLCGLLRADQAFYRRMLSIAVPVALQNLVATLANYIDVILVGGLGETAIAAVSLANQVFFLYNLFIFGVCSGAAIFTAQFWGERDIVNIRRVLGLCLSSALIVGAVFFAAAFFLPAPLLGLFSRDPEVIRLGARYLRMVSWTYPAIGVTFSFCFTLRAIGQPILPMFTTFLAFGLNTCLNYLLIYGRLGLPRLGTDGAAIATLLARLVEISVLLAAVYALKMEAAAKPKELLDLSAAFIKRFYRTTLPVIFNESLWSLGVTMYTVVYARMGTRVIAAYNMASTVERLAMVFFFGLSQACAVMVGECIGAGREDEALEQASRFAVLGPALGFVIGGLVLLFSGTALAVFKVSPDAAAIARAFTMVFGLTIPVRIFNLLIIVGILRSGGDTRFSLFIDTFGLWCLAVPLAFLAGLVLKLPPVVVYLCGAVEEVFKFVLGLGRLRSRKWVNNLVCGMREAVSGV